MARFDKYEPLAGGFRARLAADWVGAADANLDGLPLAVGLDTDGHVVPGEGNTGILGVLVLVGVHKKAGDVVDVMTSGEILEIDDDALAGRAAGVAVFADTTTGALTATSGSNTPIGFMVEDDRLVVRVAAS